MGNRITYLKLGTKASNFFDQQTRLKIAGNQVVAWEKPLTPRLREAMGHGHIVESSESEFETFQAGKAPVKGVASANEVDPMPSFKGMTKAELMEYVDEQDWDLDDEDDLSSLKKDELVDKVTQLYKENN